MNRREKSGPLYQQLADELKQLIQERHTQGGQFLSEAQIEQRFKVSRITVRHALRILEREGYIFREPGKAPLVSRLQPVVNTGHRLGRLAEELRGMGLNVSARYFDFDIVSPPLEDFAKMSIEFPYSGVFRFKHLLLIDAKPISYATNFILVDPAIVHLTKEELEGKDSYDVLAREYDITIVNGDQSIGAVAATRELARILNVRIGAPLLKTEIAAFSKEGLKKLFAVVYFDASLFQFRQLILR